MSAGSPSSLVRTLLLGLMLPLLVIVGTTGALGVWWAQRQADATFDRWLVDGARSLALQLRFEDDRARLNLGGDAEAILAFDVLDRSYYSVRQGPRLVAGHAGIPQAPPGLQAQGDLLFFDSHIQQQPVRVVRLTVPKGHPQTDIYIAETRLKRQEVQRDIELMLIPTALLLLAAAVAILAAVRWTLRPVQALADRWLAQSHRSLEPVDTASVPRELLPLASALNGLFERLKDVLARERRFTANAAHQIRTPLTGLQLGLSRAAQAHDLATIRQVIDELQGTTQRTSRLLQQLLALSRLDPEALGQQARQDCDLRELTQAVAQTYLQAALRRQVQFDLVLPEQPVAARVQPELLSEALGNLIDNALRYSPTGAAVRISVQPGDPPCICVEDSGPGIPFQERQGLLERFARGPAMGSGIAAGLQGEGSGLGLAIAQEIAQAHGGSLTLETSEWGGLRVRLGLAGT